VFAAVLHVCAACGLRASHSPTGDGPAGLGTGGSGGVGRGDAVGTGGGGAVGGTGRTGAAPSAMAAEGLLKVALISVYGRPGKGTS
jgi:hypothetical protein